MPGPKVVDGAVLMCTFGAAPGSLKVLPDKMVKGEGKPSANIMDHKPNVNIQPFGMCMSLANPQVAAATSAAMGVLTPQPCVPMTMSPWSPGAPTVTIKNFPALTQSDICNCTWAGVITITFAGQVTVTK